jgi:hypothetical protein
MRYNVHVTGTRFIGVDLAWREGSADLMANPELLDLALRIA